MLNKTNLENKVKLHRFLCDQLHLNYVDLYINSVQSSIFSDYYIVRYLNLKTDKEDLVTVHHQDIRKYSDFFIIDNGCIKYSASKLNRIFRHLPDRFVDLNSGDPYSQWVSSLIYMDTLSSFHLAKWLYPELFYWIDAKYNSFYHALRDDLSGIELDKQDEYIKLLCIFQLSVDSVDEPYFFTRLLELDSNLSRVKNGRLYVYNDHHQKWQEFDRDYYQILGFKFLDQLQQVGVN